MREQILAWIEQDRDEIIRFIQEFVRAASPNPPGDTLKAMRHVRSFLDRRGIAYDIRSKVDNMPNLVATADFSSGDRHLVLNGHLDVFPVENPSQWTHGPWDAVIHEETLYGRGVADMKVGSTASLFTYMYLQRLKEKLKGRLTLTLVSDEETFGPNGANYLFSEFADEITGTACLSGEPSSPHTVRFGEKGAVWLRFVITTPGGHGAYAHLSPNAIDLAYELIRDLRSFISFSYGMPQAVVDALEASKAAFEKANGAGASTLAGSIVMNVGTMKAGPKVNMIASRCEFEVDFRLPVGVRKADLMRHVEHLQSKHSFSYEIMMVNESNWCDPEADIAQVVREAARTVTGINPADVLGMGNTDTRLWRYRKVPAVIYGPTPRGMGGADENVPLEEALNVLRVHALSACAYLS
ncbi:MAG: M20/M25/M40 family metallo-hydrolase [Desulfovibrio sp.]|jgi:succinyl-diaminopimelate desuccinylase|nr:M20/M25/M40 family metallo-hydrolase [Desulfovibrio sp.]